VLTLSHGQRGFSVNKEVLVENLEKKLQIGPFSLFAALEAKKAEKADTAKDLKRKLKREEFAQVEAKKDSTRV